MLLTFEPVLSFMLTEITMAYIPPHKRNSSNNSSLKPQLLNQPKSHPKLKPRFQSLVQTGDIVYARSSIHKLLISDNKHVPSPLFLKPLSWECIDYRLRDSDVRVLIKSNVTKDNNEAESVAVAVWPDLLSSVDIMRTNKQNIHLAARIGKKVFHGGPNPKGTLEGEVDEQNLRQMRNMFHTDLTTCSSYIINNVVSKIGALFVEEKRRYCIKLSDRAYPNLVLICKCRSTEDSKKLHLYKVELIPIRQMVTDIACINKNLDLRISLCSKRISTDYTEEEMQCIRDIVDSAIMDSEVKGGLRWPFGKASSGNRFTVVVGTFKVTKIYNSPLLKIKERHSNRFEFRSSTGGSTVELDLKFNGFVSSLQEDKVDEESSLDMFKRMLRLIWDHFLSYEQ